MAGVLDQFVKTVRSKSSLESFPNLAEQLLKSTETLAKNAQHLDNVLASLDLERHTMGIQAVLLVKFSMPNITDYEPLWAQFGEFINGCSSEQVRFSTEQYSDLCHHYAQSLVNKKQPMRGIALLCKAINKLQSSPSQLTGIHADLCQLCLLAKCFKPALQFLEVDITEIEKELFSGPHADARPFLLYYYYGGMIFTALKMYDKAIYFFEIAITTPSMAVSHIMLESYKKYILVSLIFHGKVLGLPKYTSQVVARFIKPLSQSYNELASAYATNHPDAIRAAIGKHEETFNRDSNAGLVKQCLSSLYKKNIQRLTKTFVTLSLTDMANRVRLNNQQEAEKYVLTMIEDGEIFATINHKDGMVSFYDNPQNYDSAEKLREIGEEIRKCAELDEKLRAMDDEILVNNAFVQKQHGTPSPQQLSDELMQESIFRGRSRSSVNAAEFMSGLPNV